MLSSMLAVEAAVHTGDAEAGGGGGCRSTRRVADAHAASRLLQRPPWHGSSLCLRAQTSLFRAVGPHRGQGREGGLEVGYGPWARWLPPAFRAGIALALPRRHLSF